MFNLLKTLAALIVAIALAGCAPDTRSTAFQQFAPQSSYHPIKIFRYKSPECDFQEVGIVNARQRNRLISMHEVIESIRTEARRLGGDAVIGLSETNPIHNINEYGIDRDPVLSGTVIKFTNSNCNE